MDYKIITNNKNWMEHNAISQFKNVSNLENVVDSAALPDLHAGIKSPVGIVLKVKDKIYPHIIGNDIGCGMTLFNTRIKNKQFKKDRWVTKLNNIRSLEDLDYEIELNNPIKSFASLGGGNHFAEFQVVNEIFMEDEFLKITDDKSQILLLVHSGSRDYGQRILNKFHTFEGISSDSDRFEAYLKEHDTALFWAEKNRLAVSCKLIKHLGFNKEPESLINCFHNFVEKEDGFLVHRKGVVSSKKGYVVIPGSRGSLTYIVKPRENTESSLNSLSHGAGRKWARSVCKTKIDKKYDRNTIRETKFKSRVVCHDTNLLFQEAPEVYKNIDNIIKILSDYNLIDVVATLKPLITFKS